MPFDGATYERAKDGKRLLTQLERVRHLMSDGAWRTLPNITHHVGGSEAGVSARLRDLRKPKFGGFEVKRRRKGISGLYEYQLKRPTPTGQIEMF